MALVGSILSKVVDLKKSIPELKILRNSQRIQKNQLLKLLRKARGTAFGKHYHFDDIFFSKDPIKEFQKNVPVHDYDKMFDGWWHRCLKSESDVCWPGQVKYFALSSGTSGSSSKHIPLTKEMIRNIKRSSIKQILSLSNYDLPEGLLNRGYLMIGGSTHLVHMGNYYEGDLSGITASKIPSWFQYFYKPGKEIAMERDWPTKIEMIVNSAKDWDIAILVGVPAWIQIIVEKIIEKYQLKTIHDIWPNLKIFVHGGVAFTPYKKGFERLMGKEMIYIENYLASEGFIAYTNRPNAEGMMLNIKNGIFYEFVPFNEENFEPDGSIKPQINSLSLADVEEGKEYAILLSTNAGAWRYLIGDVVKFTSKEKNEIIITGRTKHFLSLVGEHLSVDNMNSAIEKISTEYNLEIPEFTVAGIKHENLFAHHWYLGINGSLDLDKDKVIALIDSHLKQINDDYAVERGHALKKLEITLVHSSKFIAWLKSKGKEGGQNKFPRVLNEQQQKDWEQFLLQNN